MNMSGTRAFLFGARGIALAGLVAAGAASAAGGQSPQAQQQYDLDRAKCMRGDSNQDRATCLKEAGAAFQEAKSHTVGQASKDELAENRLQRCEGLPAAEHDDCVARMNDGTTSGTAQQGGILREASRPAN
jgi:hypothetical protein